MCLLEVLNTGLSPNVESARHIVFFVLVDQRASLDPYTPPIPYLDFLRTFGGKFRFHTGAPVLKGFCRMLFPTEEEYIQWFRNAGFRDVKVTRIGPWWYHGVRRCRKLRLSLLYRFNFFLLLQTWTYHGLLCNGPQRGLWCFEFCVASEI